MNAHQLHQLVDAVLCGLSAADTARQKVLPEDDDAIVVSGAAGAYTDGSYATLVASTAKRLRVVGVHVEAVTGVHNLRLATGAAASEVVFAELIVAETGYFPVHAGPGIASGTRLSAKTNSKAGGAQDVEIRLVVVEDYRGI